MQSAGLDDAISLAGIVSSVCLPTLLYHGLKITEIYTMSLLLSNFKVSFKLIIESNGLYWIICHCCIMKLSCLYLLIYYLAHTVGKSNNYILRGFYTVLYFFLHFGVKFVSFGWFFLETNSCYVKPANSVIIALDRFSQFKLRKQIPYTVNSL